MKHQGNADSESWATAEHRAHLHGGRAHVDGTHDMLFGTTAVCRGSCRLCLSRGTPSTAHSDPGRMGSGFHTARAAPTAPPRLVSLTPYSPDGKKKLLQLEANTAGCRNPQIPSGCVPPGTDGWGCNCANGTEPCDGNPAPRVPIEVVIDLCVPQLAKAACGSATVFSDAPPCW